MWRVRVGVTVVALMLFGAAYAQKGDDKKKDDKPPAKLKGQLPPYFKKLGLRDDQVQQIYKVRADYKEKRDELQRKLDQLKNEERLATEKILTPEQMKRLKELRLGEKTAK